MSGMLTSASRSALPGMMVLGFLLSVLACSPPPATEGQWRGLTIAPEDRGKTGRYPVEVHRPSVPQPRGNRHRAHCRQKRSARWWPVPRGSGDAASLCRRPLEPDPGGPSAEPLRQDSQGRGGLDAGAEPLLVCTPGGQGEAQVRADGGLARDASPGRGAGRLRRWIDWRFPEHAGIDLKSWRGDPVPTHDSRTALAAAGPGAAGSLPLSMQ